MNTLTITHRLQALLKRKQVLRAGVTRDVEFASRLCELQAWQTARLARTYADLRADRRYIRAVDFFLSDLYGGQDFSQRDRDLARAASLLGRALPQVLLDIACEAVELDVLTAELDQLLAAQLSGAVTAPSYALAYRAVGRRADRQRQIELVVAIGTALDAVVRQGWVGLALRAAHVPAHLAGLGVLQDFLERGWRAFKALPTAQLLLAHIRSRESALMDALFQGRADAS